jgi:colanic acid biosynthesis glycosyl transferase WcaI
LINADEAGGRGPVSRSTVLIHALVFSPDGVSTADLLTELALRLRARGHEVRVITATPHFREEPEARRRQPLRRVIPGLLQRSSLDGIDVWHVQVGSKKGGFARRALGHLRFHILSIALGLAPIGRYDVVLAVSPPLGIGAAAWAMNVFRRRPVIYNVQELYPDFAINQGYVRSRLVIGLLRRLERFVYKRSAAVVTISESFARVVESRGVAASKIHVIANFVDTKALRPVPRTALRQELAGEAALVVYYGGNIGLSQDWDLVLDAAAEMENDDVCFVISGGGLRSSYVEEQIRARGISNISLAGYLPRERLPELHAACDIAIIPMLPRTSLDTFPSKIYSLMAGGLAVIATAEPESELAKTVADAGCGVVVAPRDRAGFVNALHTLLTDAPLRARLGASGRRFVAATHDTAVAACRYGELIDSLIRLPTS